jgi:hypothetical protein
LSLHDFHSIPLAESAALEFWEAKIAGRVERDQTELASAKLGQKAVAKERRFWPFASFRHISLILGSKLNLFSSSSY